MDLIELTADAFAKIDWESSVNDASTEDCNSFFREFISQRKRAEENENVEEYTLYDLLGRITSFILKPEGEHQVFVPQFSGNGTRTALPEDITDQELDVLQEVFPDTFQNPELRARVGDLLWYRRRDHEAAKESIKSYVESVNKLGTYEITKLKRAHSISRMLGAPDERKVVTNKIETLIEENKDKSSNTFFVRDLIRLLYVDGNIDFSKYSTLAWNMAEREKEKEDFRKARAMWEEAAICFRKDKNSKKTMECWIEIGESFEVEVDSQKSAMQNSDTLMKAIEAYRKVPDAEKKRSELHSRLIQTQENIPDELHSYSTEVELTDYANEAIQRISGLELHDAMMGLIQMVKIISYDELKEQVRNHIQQFPMRYMIGATSINEMGKNVARIPSVLSSDKEEYNEALLMHMVQEAQYHRQINVNGYINPVRNKIIEEHFISDNDLFEYVRNHPFIKNGHEYLIIEGLLKGFYGDWVNCGHILCTQFEECLRHYMRIHGIITSGLDDDGIQQEKSLNQLLEDEFVKKSFGEDLAFEFQSILVHPNGSNLRNKVAHGLMNFYDFHTYPIIYFWWLFLRLVLTPALNLKAQERQEANSSEE